MTLIEACAEVGITLAFVAKRSSLPYSVVYALAKGQTKLPSHSTIVRVVRVLREAGSDITTSDICPVPHTIEVPADAKEDYSS